MTGNLPKPRSKIAKALAFLLTIDVQYGDIARVARRFVVKPRTLAKAWAIVVASRERHSITTNNRDVLRVLHLTEARGATTNRLLTDAEEAVVVNELRTRYPQGFVDANIVQICRDTFHHLRNHPRVYSRHFLHAFKKRASIRKSKVNIHQRTLADFSSRFEADVDSALDFVNDVWELTKTIPPHLFVNADETPAYVRNLPTHALHFTDQPRPWFWVRAKERDAVTVIGAVTGDGHVLNSGVVAKGTTTRCEAKFRAQLSNTFVQHTASGLTTSDSFLDYLQHVILPYTDNRPSVLIVDAHKAHCTAAVKLWCENHSITLLIVPDRATSVLQPLDVTVFGLAKLKVYRDVASEMFEINRSEQDRWEATAACVKALSQVSSAGVKHGWKATFPFWADVLKAHNLD